MRATLTERRDAAPRALLLAALCLTLPFGAAADDATEAPSPAELLQRIEELERRLLELELQRADEVDELRAGYERELAELEARLAETGAGDRSEGELEALRREAEQTADAIPREREPQRGRESAAGRQRSLQALNPELSFLGDVSYDWTDTGVADEFVLRGAEISLQSALDPYTRFKGYVDAHQEPGRLGAEDEDEELTVSLEEAYVEWVALPLSSRLRVGKFRQQFGTLNRWHPHALPSTDVPFALRNLFGDEGLIGLGISYDLQLPGLWATSNALTVELVNADSDPAFGGASFSDPALLLRHTGFFDLSADSYFEINLNGMHGRNDDEDASRDTTLGSVDFNFVWEPVQRARDRAIEVRGEYFRTRLDGDDGTVEAQSFFLYVTAKLDRRWGIGFRYDDAELPSDRVELLDGQEFREGLRERGWTAVVSFWQSEFVRLRFQYQRAERDFVFPQGPDDDDRLWLQATFAAGPHRHEAY